MSKTADNPKRVHVIQPKPTPAHSDSGFIVRKKRVAAYARVSTDEDEQLSSYEAQVDFYTKHIQSNLDWEFVCVYADEGITGTNTKRRDEFNRMVADALNGKIDLILTKSISRFARNTVDTLTTVRKLKEKGVEVFFEKENIYTLDSKGELLITIMSSLAQEESRSISENVTWGKRKSMEDGKVFLAYKHFLGYKKGKDGLPQIVEEEAKVIREIYNLYLQGQTVRSIAEHLTCNGIPTPAGKSIWSVSTIMSILQNEKYKGDALLQKTYTVDFLSKATKKNEGELPQYYIENSHPPIISPETFDLVQSEIKRRRLLKNKTSNSIFATKIICGECGSYYGSKVWHSNSKHRTHIWRCNRKYGGDTPCATQFIREDEIKAGFISAFNQILGDKEQYVAKLEKLVLMLADTSALEENLTQAQTDSEEANLEIRRYMEDNTQKLQNQAEYEQRFNEMSKTCKLTEQKIVEVKDEILEQKARREKMARYLETLKRHDNPLNEFDENLWQATVETVTVYINNTLNFNLKDGATMEVEVLKRE